MVRPSNKNYPTSPIFVDPGSGEVIGKNDQLVTKVSSKSTGGAYCLFERITQPGTGVELHIHENEDEIYHILEGEYEIRCGDVIYKASKGAVAVLPRKIPHSSRNVSDEVSRALLLCSPGGFDNFMEELSKTGTPENRNAIYSKYGFRLLS